MCACAWVAHMRGVFAIPVTLAIFKLTALGRLNIG